MIQHLSTSAHSTSAPQHTRLYRKLECAVVVIVVMSDSTGANNKEAEGKVSLARKLTADETTELQGKLRPLLGQTAEEEYINDIIEYSCAMVSNQKTVNYVVEELTGMEMDFCPPAVIANMAQTIRAFVAAIAPGVSGAATADEQAQTAESQEQTVKSRLVSIKSSSPHNALTMSGALGASRQGGRKPDDKKKETVTTGRGKNRLTENKDGDRKQQHPRDNDRKKNSHQEDTERRRSSSEKNDRRDRQGRAFDRLTEGDDSHSNSNNSSNNNGRRGPDNRRGPRDGGGGRHGGRGDSRGDMRGRGDRDDRRQGGRGPRGGPTTSGQRRDRDDFQEEADYVPAEHPRGAARPYEGRGHRGGGRGGGRGYEAPSKRARLDEGGYDHFPQEDYYDDGYEGHGYPPRGGGRWHGGGGYRGRGFRGRGGRYGGRGRADYSAGWDESHQEAGEGNPEEVSEGASNHPSPIVQASYGGFRGRGFRGGRGRGRGRSFAGRVQVKNKIASMSWVRKKEGDDSGGHAGESSEAAQGES